MVADLQMFLLVLERATCSLAPLSVNCGAVSSNIKVISEATNAMDRPNKALRTLIEKLPN